MIDKTLTGLFRVVADEAAANPAFASRLEESLAKFAEDFVETRRATNRVGDFHPFIEFRKGTIEEFRARLMRFDAKELRVIVDRHHLDPSSSLKSKASRKAVADHILSAAQKRTDRDARLFEY